MYEAIRPLGLPPMEEEKVNVVTLSLNIWLSPLFRTSKAITIISYTNCNFA